MNQLQTALTQAVKALASLKGETLEAGSVASPTTEVVVAKTVEDTGAATTEAPKTTSDGQKGGKRKTRKGGKRKLNGFMKFANTQRAKLMSANPGKAVSEIGKMLGAAWRNLSDEEKASFK